MRIKQFIFFVLIVIVIITLSGCLNSSNSNSTNEGGLIDKAKKEQAVLSCQNECKVRKQYEDFSNGPCLSNSTQPDWVCDIAHTPRLPVDNESENQCSAYRDKTAHHFVELDPECNLIKAQ